MMGQGVSWYASHFYAPVFMERMLGLPQLKVNELMITIVVISAPLYVFFAWASDRVGRKPIMLFGMALFTLSCIPAFHVLTNAVNPALAAAQQAAPVTVFAAPGDCTFQLDLTGGARQFASSCDIAKGTLSNAGISYTTRPAPAGTLAHVRIGGLHGADVAGVSATGESPDQIKKARAGFEKTLRGALATAGYPAGLDAKGTPLPADPGHYNFLLALGAMFVLIVAATALYGPQAAALVELFPTRIRYTALSFPYNVGTGWFGGLLPPIVFAISTTTGNIYSGLWFPVIVTGLSAVICLLFWPETKDRDIHA
jgi:MFS family permease